ncbi:MAG: ferredoxin [Aquificota bacterium]|nr:MAG: ferredoxin [Aquificota bacterium]
MKVYIDVDTCTACELCYDRLPRVFADRGDGIPIVVLKDAQALLSIKDEIIAVAEDCPSGSIAVEVG